MNLIEKLGGYERAKSELKDKKWRKDNLHGSAEFTWHMKQHIQLLESVLLEYRRQHNILEVGDDVVFNRGNVDLWVFSGASEVKPYDVKVSNKIVRHILLSKIRHATDAEIKAGRRLPVIESDDCSGIRNHISPNTVVIDQ